MNGIEHSFLIADLVGFTSLTERRGDEEAADCALAFIADASRLAGEHGCELVKSMGDAVLIHGHEPARVVAIALRLAELGRSGRWGLRVRIGIHTGTAVQRGDDWFGAAVNVASRLVDSAAPGEILLSGSTWGTIAAEPAPSLRVADRGARSFKNVAAPLDVFAAAA